LLIRHVIFVGWLPIDVKKEHSASVVDRGDVDYKVECPAWHSSEASGTSGEAILECRPLLYQLRRDETGTRGAANEKREEAYGGADREPAAAG
jgi:hypothetical protein